jgi:hypothetical protein
MVGSWIHIVDPIEAVAQPPTAMRRGTGPAEPGRGLQGQTVAFVYLEDWRNFEMFLTAIEGFFRERLGVGNIKRVTSSLRRGPLTAEDLAAIRGSAAALVGLGA